MIKVEFNIWTWKDYKKWFWDKFCFPRRKTITEWLDSYASDIHEEAVNCYIFSMGYSNLDDFIQKAEPSEHIVLENFEKSLKIREQNTIKRYVGLILKCK